jgi:hypothetical protein
MSQKLLDLAARRGALCARIAAQRQALAYHSRGLAGLLDKGDAALRGVDWIKRNPLAIGAAVTAAVVMRPGRAFRWTRRGFFLWQGWRKLRSTLMRL